MWIWLSRDQITARGSEEVGSFTFQNGKITVACNAQHKKANHNGVFLASRWMTFNCALYNFIGMYIVFYDNSSSSRALIGQFLSSISGQTHEFIIYAMRQRAIADNLTVCYRKKQIDVSFSCVCSVTDNEFRHYFVKVVCGSTWLPLRYFDNVMTKFMINNRTDAWKTDVNLLIRLSVE